MNEARHNPIAQAKARGEQIVQVADLGDGFALMGVSLEPVITDDGKVALFAVLNCCKPSPIVGIDKVVKVAAAKLGEMDLNGLKVNIAKGLGEEWAPKPAEPVA